MHIVILVTAKDEDQAKFILDQIYSNKSGEELGALLSRYKKQGLLTENVKGEMKRLLKEDKYEEPKNLFQRFFQ